MPADHSDQPRLDGSGRSQPLAARMRPRTLEEVAGQQHVIGPGRLLRRAIEADQLSSIILYGPPGTGKTTLARVIANTTRAHFIAINAVLAGVKDLRQAIKEAGRHAEEHGRRTILFVDEVHRWNKAQQDALLPWVEAGTVILIGATTENPYFEVIKPLVSRSRIFQLLALDADDLRALARRALEDAERGYGRRQVDLRPEALDHLVDVAGGDARSLLNALQLAVETTDPADGPIVVDLAVAEESIQRRAVLYDKDGDAHYDTISAFIKSVRGSDPDAALYWLARMVYAGEDPRFLFRRMLILAAEDVGLADPHAVGVVAGCAQAFDYVGMPEGRFHLAEAALYLATAAKSNSALGFFDALGAVGKEAAGDVPTHLRDASRDAEGFGHGAGYAYPHAFRDHWVAQRYLPAALTGRVFYQPSAMGYEGEIAVQVARRREEQLAAMLDDDGPDGGGLAGGAGEGLTAAGSRVADERERWLARVAGGRPAAVAAIRDRVLDGARVRRHHVVIDLAMGTGLLTWELLRRAPEGGVYALAPAGDRLAMARQMVESAPAGERPVLLAGGLGRLREALAEAGAESVRFDAAAGRGALARLDEPEAALSGLRLAMAPGARLSIAETDGASFPALTDLFPLPAARGDLAERIVQVQRSVAGATEPAPERLRALLEAAGFAEIAVEEEHLDTDLRVSPAWIDRLLGAEHRAGPLAQALRRELSADDLAALRTAATAAVGRTVTWRRLVIYARAAVANSSS